MQRSTFSRRLMTVVLGAAALGAGQPALAGPAANVVHAQPATSTQRAQAQQGGQNVRLMSEVLGGNGRGAYINGMSIPKKWSQRQIRIRRRRIA